MTHTKHQAAALQAKFDADRPGEVLVDYAMRYGQPSVGNAMDSLLKRGARKVVVLPLYPQYCASTTGSTFDALAEDFVSRRWLPELRFINQYHDDTRFVQCVADSIKAHWDKHGRADKLVFSYRYTKRYLLVATITANVINDSFGCRNTWFSQTRIHDHFPVALWSRGMANTLHRRDLERVA